MDHANESHSAAVRLPIRIRLSLFATLLLLLCTISLALATFFAARSILDEQIDSRLSVIAQGRRQLLSAYVNQQHERVALVSSRTRLRKLITDFDAGLLPLAEMQEETRNILLDAMQSTDGFLAISITDLEGRVITSTSDDFLERNMSGDPAFVSGIEEGFFGAPVLDRKEWRSIVSGPIESADAAKLGVVIVSLDVQPMVRFMSDWQSLGESGEVLVGIPDGSRFRFLLPPRHDPLLVGQSRTDGSVMARAINGERSFVTTQDYRGHEVLATYVPLGYRDWGLVAKIDTEEALAPVDRLARLILGLGALTLLVGLVIALWFARRATKPILQLTDSVNRMATGDLSADLFSFQPPNDEVGDLATAFSVMRTQLSEQHTDLKRQAAIEREQREAVESLTGDLTLSLESEKDARKRVEELLSGIRDAVSTLGAATEKLTFAAESQVRTVQDQAVCVTETCSTISEVTLAARQAADHAGEVERSSSEAAKVGQSGLESVRKTRDVMHDVQNHFEDTVTHVLSLAEKAQAIGSIIAVVNEIAEQTNVLALNAAVEASRAGESGRGFAVVAIEVKRLAQQSQESAQQIHRILTDTIRATSTAIESAERGHNAISAAGSVIGDASATIDRLAQIINAAAQAASKILASTGQQATAMSQIQHAMSGIEDSSNQSTAAAHDCERSAQDLDRLGKQLRELMNSTRSPQS